MIGYFLWGFLFFGTVALMCLIATQMAESEKLSTHILGGIAVVLLLSILFSLGMYGLNQHRNAEDRKFCEREAQIYANLKDLPCP